jgi:predicted MPP superfamily phosphohydrolase
MVISVFIALSLYLIFCYYIGLKGKNIIINIKHHNIYKVHNLIYWIIYWSIALAFIFSNMLRGILTTDNLITTSITIIGAAYIAILFYSVLTFLIVDILKLILKRIDLNSQVIKFIKKIYFNGITVFVLIAIILSIGAFNVQNTAVTSYELSINKQAGASGEITSLNIVMISDVHMGIGIQENGVDRMIHLINQLDPDIVLFCGDIFDESTTTRLKEYSREAFKNIKSKYGVYAITGNHEYNAGDIGETISYFKDANITYLQDEAIKIENSFYIVGRNDPVNVRITGQDVKPLSELLKDVDKSIPIIVLNHRPERLQEAEEEGVDLQLSGHTHKGQMFPGNLITERIYKKDYGYLKSDNFNLIVSSGYGTWGPPVRIGSRSEIVNIKVDFNKSY